MSESQWVSETGCESGSNSVSQSCLYVSAVDHPDEYPRDNCVLGCHQHLTECNYALYKQTGNSIRQNYNLHLLWGLQ